MNKGASIANGPMPHQVPQEVLDAKAVSTTSWDLIEPGI
jgi:hypothetical protein